ncbi:uncharacterized protein LOC128547547 [Mercenaria mercenaria]|uniref:uncharacterized protein LOC128547547 n=1 Tax=Mercenaria mercenaria TaxID=6596 RepID=UPI00234EFDD1|nr:uncharacterized protein LOC128547547 [Mercenaria mercenaria]
MATKRRAGKEINRNQSMLLVVVTGATNGTEDSVTNVAVHKETLQSHLTQHDSSLIVDGNTDQYVANGSCINIEKKGNSWWQVDLGDIYTIFRIRYVPAVTPWCYTTDPNVTAEYCDVEECETVTTDDLNLKTGTRVKTLEIPDYIEIADPEQHIRDFIMPSNSQARYVEFHQDGTADYYPLCEVEVYGVKDDVTNVALRKTAHISTVNPENLFDQSLAIDGIPDQDMLEGGSCFNTAEEDNPWWRVDLADIFMIFLVRLYNRLDCCSDLAHDVQLRVGTSLDTMIDAALIKGQIDNIQNIILGMNTEARFVELVRNGWGVFHLCEVEVFGRIGTYNVAVGKQIEASSIYHRSWLASNAIDGDTNQDVKFGATCVSTQKEIKPYLMLDLGDEYNITGVNIYRRLDCCRKKT